MNININQQKKELFKITPLPIFEIIDWPNEHLNKNGKVWWSWVENENMLSFVAEIKYNRDGLVLKIKSMALGNTKPVIIYESNWKQQKSKSDNEIIWKMWKYIYLGIPQELNENEALNNFILIRKIKSKACFKQV